jgi:predicted PurR-regulated permease PerM
MATTEETLQERAGHSRTLWRQLGLRLRATTPLLLARFLLVTVAMGGLVWLLWSAWPALIPFIIGGIIAYAVLPAVNWLDRFLPRRLAAFLTMLTVVGILALFVVRLIPALGIQIGRVAAVLPSADELRDSAEGLNSVTGALPPAVQNAIQFTLEETVASLNNYMDNFFSTLPLLAVNMVLGLIKVVGAVLGLLVLPTWLLVVLTDQQKGVQAINRILPRSIRADFWGVARVLDRSFRTFFQNQVLQGVLVAVFMFLALWILDSQGLIQVAFPLVVALFVGLLELIPELGPLVAIVVLGLAALLISPATAILAVGVYLLLHWLVGNYVAGRAGRKVREVHPALLIVAVVVLSQLGLFWVLLAVPVLTATRDLFRYAFGRLSEPPRPAGLLPDERENRAAALARSTPAHVPLVYRRQTTAAPRADR